MADVSDATALATVNDLPNECLRDILLRIPIIDRVHLRRACRRWREVIDDSWSSVRKIICREPTEQKNKMIQNGDTISITTSTRRFLEGLMNRCGSFVTHLDDTRKDPVTSLLPFAVKYCNNNIKKLSIVISSKADDKHLSQLFAINQQVRVLKLHIKFKNTKVCFRHFSTDVLESFTFEYPELHTLPPSIEMNHKQIICKADALKELTSNFVDDEVLHLIGQKVKLEMLDMMYQGPTLWMRDVLYPILNLRNLRILTIRESLDRRTHHRLALPVGDGFLVGLAENVKLLESFTLGACYITNKGLVHLASLPKLRKLKFCCCLAITDEFLFHLSGLEELCVSMCNIRDEGVIALLERAQGMRELDLSKTYITNETLIAAIKETKKRDNGVCLKLLVSDTNVTPWTISEISPLLEIVN